jgi:hypothetical protein
MEDPDPATTLRTYLEIAGNGSTSIVVNWHSCRTTDTFAYRALSAVDWVTEAAVSKEFPFRPEKIHSVELTGLNPATVYEFRPGESSETKRFRTVPAISNMRIAYASDMHTKTDPGDPEGRFNIINDLMGAAEPDLLIAVGDILGDEGDFDHNGCGEEQAVLWARWIDDLEARLIRDDGTLIPVNYLVGNHDARGDDAFAYIGRLFHWPYNKSAFVPSKGYGYCELGNSVLVIGLMSGVYGNPKLLEQVGWVSDLLAEKAANFTHITICGHIGPFPSIFLFGNQYDSSFARKALRRELVPILQTYPNIRFFISGHEHNFFASKPVTILPGEEDFTVAGVDTPNDPGHFTPGGPHPNGPNGNARRWKLDPAGIVYIGQGAWSAEPFAFEGDLLISTVDGSSYVDVGIGRNPADRSQFKTVGTVTPIDGSNKTQAFWYLDFGATTARARCVNLHGGIYADITRELSPGSSSSEPDQIQSNSKTNLHT